MQSETNAPKIPVILDTDIGTDIDDTWALAMLLRSPEIDLKLVVSDTGDTLYRAKLLCKLLEIAGRVDIPVGIGIPLENAPKSQNAWVEDYEVEKYPGKIYTDGVGAMIDCIISSPEPVTILAIGPVANIASALDREADITKNARFVGMQGSIREGYKGKKEISPEYNIVKFPHSCQKVFTAPWEITITPLDTCSKVLLDGNLYRPILACHDELIKAVIENYRIWAGYPDWIGKYDPDRFSSTLYDTVAVYLCFSQELLHMEDLDIAVTDDGYTVIREGLKSIHCATGWKDIIAFKHFLSERFTGFRPD